MSRGSGISTGIDRGLTDVLTLTPRKVSGIVSDLLLVFAFRQTHVAQSDKEVWVRSFGRLLLLEVFSRIVERLSSGFFIQIELQINGHLNLKL